MTYILQNNNTIYIGQPTDTETFQEIHEKLEVCKELSMKELTLILSVNPILELLHNLDSFYDGDTNYNWGTLSRIFHQIDTGLYNETFYKDTEANTNRFKMLISRLTNSLNTNIDQNETIEDEWLERTTDDIKQMILILHKYVPDFKLDDQLKDLNLIDLTKKNIQSEPDQRFSVKAPTNKEKIKALKMYCPELFNILIQNGKPIQQNVIRQITGVNLEDSYKYSFGSNQHELDKHEVINYLDNK
tara:strand:+ start:567 stop:1301 length:735 start_codon:yes stop_codon:yes gene_type:complete